MKTIKIIQDDREPDLQMIADSLDLGIEFVRERMKEGDYMFEDILIERKTIDDLCGSIIDGRMERQQEKMKKYEKKFLIVVGNLKDRKATIHENCVIGKIISLIIKHNIKVIQVEDEFQFVYALKNIIKKEEEVKDEKQKSN